LRLNFRDSNGLEDEKIVKQGNAEYRVPTDGLAAGLYVLRLVNAKETRSQKIRIN
jgi:hypothetical protein